MTRWAMVADLERCVGCQTCTAACRHANATSPAVQWRKVLDIEAGHGAGIRVLSVATGGYSVEQLTEAGGDWVVPSLADGPLPF